LSPFDTLYSQHYNRLRRLAVRMVGNEENADDIVQDTFLVLYEALDKGTTIEYPGTWLYKVTYNKSLDCLHRKKRLLPLETVNRSTIERQEANNEEDTTSLEKKEQEALINTILASMKPRERALLVLYSEQCSYKEMAETTGLRFASVGKTLSRALDALEKQLKQHGYEAY
jgi:RNA polymerase sigma-70 factor, ECF subfamily